MIDKNFVESMELGELRRVWQLQRERAQIVIRRFNPKGMTRPARDPEERRWLVSRGEDQFVEDENAAAAAREYYARKYQR